MFDDQIARPLIWVGASRKDFAAFPDTVQSIMGYALYVAQCGGRHRNAKMLLGFGGAGVIEIVSNASGGTFRAVYTVRFKEAVFVLHAFQKKSKSGIATPRTELNLVELRLRDAALLAQGSSHDS